MVYNWIKIKQSCLLCDEYTDNRVPICTPCELDLPWLAGRCQRCAVPMPQSELSCGSCLKRPPAFQTVAAPWQYAFPIDSLITRFKHQQHWPLGRLLAALLGEHLAHAFDEGLPRPDALQPVPLASRRLRQRGFNQADIIANWLGQHLQLPVLDSLRRTRDTPAQQGLDAAARQRNLRGAFSIDQPAGLAGRHLALVDDVLTTGATAEALARLLLRAGVSRVDIYCLARTPSPADAHR